MKKHTILVPIIFLVSSLIIGFFFHEEMGIKTNIFHDAIGGTILAKNSIEFEKIITTIGDDVIYCDQEHSLYYFRFITKEIELREKVSSRCDFLSNGTGKIFADLTKTFNREITNRNNLTE